MNGWPAEKKKDVTGYRIIEAPYYNFRDEISYQDGIILRGQRIIIPK